MTAAIGTVANPGVLGPILKDFYIGPLQEQLNNEVMVLQMFEKAKISWAGRQGIVPVHVDRNSGVAFKAENTDLKAAGSQKTKRLTFEAAYLYGRFEVTGPAIASAAKGGTASFIGALELEMDKLKDDIRNTADQTAVSGGRIVGFLSEHKAAAAGAGTENWHFRGDFAKVQAALDAKGTTIQVKLIDCTNLTLVPAATTNSYEYTQGAFHVNLHSINSTTGQVALQKEDSNGDVVDTTGVSHGYAIAVEITDQDASLSYLDLEPEGIYGNLAGTALMGVDRGAVAGDATALQSVVLQMDVDNSSAGAPEALNLERMQEVIDSISVMSGMTPDVILMNPIDRAKYIGLINNDIFKVADKATSGDGGFLGLSYGGIPIKSARNCGQGIFLFLMTKCWKLAVLEDGKFADLDGNVLSRVSNRDSFEGFYKWYYNHYCYRPGANGILTGFTG
jgi:hypothetical protein